MPLRRDTEEKEDYMGGDPLWGGFKPYIGRPRTRVQHRADEPLGWLEGHWNSRWALGSLDSTRKEHVLACILTSESGGGSG